MLYFSSLLQTNPTYKPAAKRLFDILDNCGEQYCFLPNTKDIWLRDFMPIRTKSGRFVSFKYKPSYLCGFDSITTDFKRDVSGNIDVDYELSEINLDGGNVVFSPSREKAIISDRVFSENPDRSADDLLCELQRLLEAKIIIIPSLNSKYDMTGHADGMVRFVDENTVIGNSPMSPGGLEFRIKNTLKRHNISVIDFPYFELGKNSAVGCYLNFLETEKHIFLPVFGNTLDSRAISKAKSIFGKPVATVNIVEIATQGGCLNCIAWEM